MMILQLYKTENVDIKMNRNKTSVFKVLSIRGMHSCPRRSSNTHINAIMAFTILVLIDCRKAFDTVPDYLLCSKLSYFGFDKDVITLINNYMAQLVLESLKKRHCNLIFARL